MDCKGIDFFTITTMQINFFTIHQFFDLFSWAGAKVFVLIQKNNTDF